MEQQEQVQNQDNTKKSGLNPRKILKIASSVLLVLTLILCVIVVSQILSQGYVSIGGYSVFRVVTPSMEPTLPVGTLLLAKEVPISDIQVDDIVVFKSKSSDMLGAVITHRVINIHTDTKGSIYLETKGDNNNSPDGNFVEQKNLIGCVMDHTSEDNVFSGVMAALTSPIGFFAFIVFPCLVFGVFVMRGIIKNIQSEMETMTQQIQQEEKSDSLKKQMDDKEYQELCERLRAEVLEELKQSADLEEKTE